MIDNIREHIYIVWNDDKARKNLYMITVAMAVLLILVPLSSALNSSTYIVDGDGSVVGIERGKPDNSESINLELIVAEEDERSVTLSMRGKTDEPSEAEGLTDEEKRDVEIQNMIAEIEGSEEKRINLPAELSDGTTLRWYRDNRAGGVLPALMIMYLVIVIAVIHDSISSVRKPRADHRDEIIRGLPRFVNQVVMMMDSGMILNDTVMRIGRSYSLIPDRERSWFERSIIEIIEDSEHRPDSAVSLLHQYARKQGVKEMLRITTILSENERRGSSARDNLKRESEFLWESRKIIAQEKGKVIDTRMSLPLALLLIILIAVTMAPALMAM